MKLQKLFLGLPKYILKNVYTLWNFHRMEWIVEKLYHGINIKEKNEKINENWINIWGNCIVEGFIHNVE